MISIFCLFRLEEELLNMYGDEWREHLPKENIDVFLEYVRLNGPTTNEPFDANRYMILANVTFEDACYIHSIKYYSTVIELDPTNLTALMKRAVCYVKVFEVRSNETNRCLFNESLGEKSYCRL